MVKTSPLVMPEPDLLLEFLVIPFDRIKECQADLFAYRTLTSTMRANRLRLWFTSMAYVLLCALSRIGLQYT